MRFTLKSRPAGIFSTLALAVGMTLAGMGSAGATGVTCQSQWDASPADTYCSERMIDFVTVCDIAATCSFTFTYGEDGESSHTMTLSEGVQVFDRAKVDEIDICTSRSTDDDGNVTFSGNLRTSCHAGEYTSTQVRTGQFHD